MQIATELVPVFAPTSSYERAWSVLRKHHFAVLEGPPEVGKSAIAWMVGLTQAAQGWETVVCQTPAVFFDMIRGSRSQVFIADDAFGRGEYDPTRMTIWEADLDLVLHRLNRRRSGTSGQRHPIAIPGSPRQAIRSLEFSLRDWLHRGFGFRCSWFRLFLGFAHWQLKWFHDDNSKRPADLHVSTLPDHVLPKELMNLANCSRTSRHSSFGTPYFFVNLRKARSVSCDQ